MKNRFLEAGQIVNTHGIQGEVKIVPWCDSPEFLCSFDLLYLDGSPIKVLSAKPHKGNVLARLEGVDDVAAAMRLKGKTVSIDRTGVELPDGRHFWPISWGWRSGTRTLAPCLGTSPIFSRLPPMRSTWSAEAHTST